MKLIGGGAIEYFPVSVAFVVTSRMRIYLSEKIPLSNTLYSRSVLCFHRTFRKSIFKTNNPFGIGFEHPFLLAT